MDFERNKRSKTQSFPASRFSRTAQPQAPERTAQTAPAWRDQETCHHVRDEELEEERMDKFYTLVEKIKAMKESWRHGGENKRAKPVLGPVWQLAFSLEDFEGAGMEARGRMSRNNGDEEKREEVQVPVKDGEEMKCHEVENNSNGLDLNLSL